MGSDVTHLLEGVALGSGASQDDLARLQASWPWLPTDYLACLSTVDGCEGYIGGRAYLRLWSAEEALRFNAAYKIPEFLPSSFLFGTDASAMGYCFDQRHSTRVLSVELAALDDEYLTPVADTFPAFVRYLAEDASWPAVPKGQWGPPPHLRGHVLHEKHPVVMGGAVDDASNRVLVAVDQHPEMMVFWARTLRSVRARTRS